MRRAGVLLALLALGAAAIGLGLQVRAHDAVERAEREALRAAQEATQAVLSYDHRTVDRDVAAAEALATGRFREEYRSATADLVSQARAGKVVVTARVQAASVVTGSTDRVVVLLFADQTTTRSDRPSPRVDQSRLRVVLEPVGGIWRLAELDSL